MLALAHATLPSSDMDCPPPMLRTNSGSNTSYHTRPRLETGYSRDREVGKDRERHASHTSIESHPAALSTTRRSSSQTRSRPSSTSVKGQPIARTRSPTLEPQNEPFSTMPASTTKLTTSSTEPHQPISSAERACIALQEYPAADLLKLLASLLHEIASSNDRLRPQSTTSNSYDLQSPISPTSPSNSLDNLTTAARETISTPTASLTFHARHVPSISLEAYLLRILKYCPMTNEVFLSLLVYFDRMSKLSVEITGKDFIIDSYNIHRLVIAGVTVASKFFSDVFYTNSRYAKVGGLPQPELNQLELQFLLLNNFNLKVEMSEMQRYALQLVAYSGGFPEPLPPFEIPEPVETVFSDPPTVTITPDDSYDPYDTEDETIRPSHSSGASETSSLATAQSDVEEDDQQDEAEQDVDVDEDEDRDNGSRSANTPPSKPRP